MNSLPSNLWEFVLSIPPNERFPLVIVAILFGSMALVGIVAVIGVTIHSIHRSRLDDALKRELVDRGLSAEEIERIVRVKSFKGVDREKVS